MRSTLDATALCKMADRGRITAGMLDGVLAFDNAVNEATTAEKGIVSSVASRADIRLVPTFPRRATVAQPTVRYDDVC